MNTNSIIAKIKDETQAAHEGYADALPLLSEFKALQNTIKECRNVLLDTAIIELGRYPDSKTEINNVKFSTMEIVRYSYDHNSTYKELKTKIKDIEKKMKLATKEGGYIDPETGEMYEPAKYTAKQTIKIQ